MCQRNIQLVSKGASRMVRQAQRAWEGLSFYWEGKTPNKMAQLVTKQINVLQG